MPRWSQDVPSSHGPIHCHECSGEWGSWGSRVGETQESPWSPQGSRVGVQGQGAAMQGWGHGRGQAAPQSGYLGSSSAQCSQWRLHGRARTCCGVKQQAHCPGWDSSDLHCWRHLLLGARGWQSLAHLHTRVHGAVHAWHPQGCAECVWADSLQQHLGDICGPYLAPVPVDCSGVPGKGAGHRHPNKPTLSLLSPTLAHRGPHPPEQCSPGARTGRAGSLPQPVISALIGSPAVPLHQG